MTGQAKRLAASIFPALAIVKTWLQIVIGLQAKINLHRIDSHRLSWAIIRFLAGCSPLKKLSVIAESLSESGPQFEAGQASGNKANAFGDRNMAADCPANTLETGNARSRVTNGKSLLVFGDGRSAGARRFRDVLAGLAAEVGGLDSLSESEKQIARRAASTSIECELIEAERAAGSEVDPTRYATVLNAQRRAMRDFEGLRKAKAGRKPKTPTLQRYLAEKASQAA